MNVLTTFHCLPKVMYVVPDTGSNNLLNYNRRKKSQLVLSSNDIKKIVRLILTLTLIKLWSLRLKGTVTNISMRQ